MASVQYLRFAESELSHVTDDNGTHFLTLSPHRTLTASAPLNQALPCTRRAIKNPSTTMPNAAAV